MRTIEFRAWDKESKKMFDPDWKGEAYGVGEIFLGQDGKVFELSSNYACEADDEGSMTDKLEAREWVVMQFTGLSDKHGKKIFEGDWLKDDQGILFQVKFGDLPLDKSGDCVCTFQAFYAEARDSSAMFKCNQIGEWMEVIGNIYENPDLLKCN